VDSPYVQKVQSLVDITGRPLFPGMRDRQQTIGACPVEYRSKLARWMTGFGGIQSHGTDGVCVRQGLLKRPQGVVSAQMPQETENEAVRDAELPLSLKESAADTIDDGLKRHAARGVRLRIEENLDVDHTVRVGSAQIGQRESMEVALIQEHGRTG